MIITLENKDELLDVKYKSPNVICIAGGRGAGKTTKLLSYALKAIGMGKQIILVTPSYIESQCFQLALHEEEKKKSNFISFFGKNSDKELVDQLVGQYVVDDLSNTLVLIDNIEHTPFIGQELPQHPDLMTVYTKGFENIYG